ncbi:hypothetical protein [Deinococcus yavapaiensis]|nr:hypothetical protein [Deinococcus yavapaiensis]
MDMTQIRANVFALAKLRYWQSMDVSSNHELAVQNAIDFVREYTQDLKAEGQFPSWEHELRLVLKRQ